MVINSKSHWSAKYYDSISNKFKCSKCSYSVKTVDIFRAHYARVHEGVIVARCPICEKIFNNINNVNEHMKQMHENKEFPCNECNYIGKTKRDLTVHTGLYHKDKTFACEFCDFKAGYQHRINRHTRQQHAKELSQNSWLKDGLKKCTFPGCEYESRTGRVNEHVKSCHEKKFGCKFDAIFFLVDWITFS